MATTSKEITEMLATLNLEYRVMDPVRQFLGVPTSSQLIADAFNKGINRCKLKDVVDDLEEMLREVTEATTEKH